jgi:hypothetical protein
MVIRTRTAKRLKRVVPYSCPYSLALTPSFHMSAMTV